MICHEDDKHFVVNTHALHNATLLRKFLPHNLTAPKPLYNDRKARHHEIAATLWITQAEKRARTAVKQKATQDGRIMIMKTVMKMERPMALLQLRRLQRELVHENVSVHRIMGMSVHE